MKVEDLVGIWRVYVVENVALLFNILWPTDEKKLEKKFKMIEIVDKDKGFKYVIPYPKDIPVDDNEINLVKECMNEAMKTKGVKRIIKEGEPEMYEFELNIELLKKLKSYLEKFKD